MGKIQFKQAYEMGLLDKVENRWYSHPPAYLDQCIPETVEGVKGLDIFYGSSRTDDFADRFKKLHPDTPVTAYLPEDMMPIGFCLSDRNFRQYRK